jgi:TonB family protein
MVFAPTPHAFTITHVAVLKTMADQISSLLLRERKTKEQGILPESPRPVPPAPVPMAKPAPALPAPVVIKPSPAAPRPAAFPVVSRVEPIKTAPIAEDLASAVARAKREGQRESKAEHRASLGTLDSLVAQTRRANSNLMIGIATVVVIVAAGTFTYRNLMRPNPTPPAPAIQQQEFPDTTSAAANGQPAGGLGGPVAQPRTSRATSNTFTPDALTSPRAPIKTSPSSLAFDNRRVETKTGIPNTRLETKTGIPNTPPGKPSPTEVVVATTGSKIANSGGETGILDMNPVLNTPGTSNAAGPLSSLTNPAATSTPTMVTQSALEPIQVLRRVTPTYPAIARARRLSGTVTVIATITAEGKATDLRFVGGPPVFRDAAFEAVRQWQFKPAKLNGRPINQDEQIRILFAPN